jgi:hypothetical protein
MGLCESWDYVSHGTVCPFLNFLGILATDQLGFLLSMVLELPTVQNYSLTCAAPLRKLNENIIVCLLRDLLTTIIIQNRCLYILHVT